MQFRDSATVSSGLANGYRSNNLYVSDDREKIKNTVLFEASSFKLSKSSKEFTGSRYDFPAILKSYNMEPEEFALFLVLLGHKFVSSSTLDFFYQREAYVTEEVNASVLSSSIFHFYLFC